MDKFIAATLNSSPRPLLLEAFGLMPEHPKTSWAAADLGAGAGRDTKAMLDCGFKVLAIDKHPDSLGALNSLKSEYAENLKVEEQSFETMSLPPLDLINAGFSLPFVQIGKLPELWSKIEQSLRPGGWFIGNFFGPEDAWAQTWRACFVEQTELEEMLEDFETLVLRSQKIEKPSVGGKMKNWHIFDVIAVKNAPHVGLTPKTSSKP